MLTRHAAGAAVAALLLSLLTALPARAQSGPYPVLLVPGLGGGLPEVRPVHDRLVEDGYQVLYFSEFDGVESNFMTAWRTAVRVKEISKTTGKVNLACWSASVMSCRHAMMYLGIVDLVEEVMLYGGGDGNWGMCNLPVYLGGDGCPTHWFAKSIRWGDGTPGTANYYLITSFPPPVTPIPDGGICYKYVPFDGFIHTQEPSQPVYLDFISAGLSGTCLGEFVDRPITNFV